VDNAATCSVEEFRSGLWSRSGGKMSDSDIYRISDSDPSS